jgi:DNA-3-methyladenine glycosylase I
LGAKKRCEWASSHSDYFDYHDEDWGKPEENDHMVFEKLSLELFQSGLSWRTILNKRENFRKAFIGFDIPKVSRFSEPQIAKLLKDEGIVRHRGKIEAVIGNAKEAKKLIKEYGSLNHYFWSFEALEAKNNRSDIGKTETSTLISRDLKKRGWRFVGPTTVYSFMQSLGIVNDHDRECFRYPQIEKRIASFRKKTLR